MLTAKKILIQRKGAYTIMEPQTITPAIIVLYLLPLMVFFFFRKSIDRHFKKAHTRIKLADLMVPYLLVGIHILSQLAFHFTIFPYFLIFIFSLAIGLLFYFAFKKGEILYRSFFKSWWRFVFLSAMTTYYGLVIAHFVVSI